MKKGEVIIYTGGLDRDLIADLEKTLAKNGYNVYAAGTSTRPGVYDMKAVKTYKKEKIEEVPEVKKDSAEKKPETIKKPTPKKTKQQEAKKEPVKPKAEKTTNPKAVKNVKK